MKVSELKKIICNNTTIKSCKHFKNHVHVQTNIKIIYYLRICIKKLHISFLLLNLCLIFDYASTQPARNVAWTFLRGTEKKQRGSTQVVHMGIYKTTHSSNTNCATWVGRCTVRIVLRIMCIQIQCELLLWFSNGHVVTSRCTMNARWRSMKGECLLQYNHSEKWSILTTIKMNKWCAGVLI